jgi:hypothetical protein
LLRFNRSTAGLYGLFLLLLLLLFAFLSLLRSSPPATRYSRHLQTTDHVIF